MRKPRGQQSVAKVKKLAEDEHLRDRSNVIDGLQIPTSLP
jgi:hypothetical protein